MVLFYSECSYKTEKTSTLNKTYRRCRKNDERPTGTNTTKLNGTTAKPENKGNSNFDSN